MILLFRLFLLRIVVGIPFLFLFSGCFEHRRYSRREIRKDLIEKGIPVKIVYYDTLGRTIRYLKIGSDTLPRKMVLMHGSPSSLEGLRSYLNDPDLQKSTQLIAPDRPGYGESDYGWGEKFIGQQSAVLTKMLWQIQDKRPTLLFGTSYGATVAARVAMDHPDYFDRLLLVCGSYKPGAERIYPISKLVPIFSAWIPGFIHVADDEKQNHYPHLVSMVSLWKKIHIPVTMVHGLEDRLLYPENPIWAARQLTQSPQVEVIYLANQRHGIMWTARPRIKSLMIRELDRLTNPDPMVMSHE
ncbi:alpha/beta fold hydrolase [Siphonobacter sp. SORGH_AS_0500]|uniref:alpha/beta fold hydrolase n=1 Tax=Siphonobacter sp. SORGH_AS_0500 TaxID=1864824 RepID=UPI001E2B4CA7|nr:alpha/beta hydrolase [Siphonobacter sp. SORGH_AS_0500]